MLSTTLLTTLTFLSSSLSLTQAAITQADFTGTGQLLVLNSSDWRTVDPAKDNVGCIDSDGRFINPGNDSSSACGTFARLPIYPYTLSSTQGNCTFNDKNTAPNLDSYYGKGDHAWSCNSSYISNIYDELYTIDGMPHVFLCSGDVDCYFDGPALPQEDEKLPFWVYRWGSQQMGITPGHFMLQLLWNKTGELPKREEEEVGAPGPRVDFLREGELQIALKGQGRVD